MSEDLISRICRHEGFREFPYSDTLGHATIGFGHKILPGEDFSAGIDYQEAIDILHEDLAKVIEQANKLFPWLLGLDDIRHGVVIEMCYQMGASGVQHFPKMIAAIRDKNYNAACKEMLNSQWHQETPLRCEELANLMLYGDEQTT